MRKSLRKDDKSILEKLNIKSSELKLTLLMLTQSAFIGILISFYYTFCNGLFLKTFTVNELPLAYVCSGILGIIVSSIFKYFTKKNDISKILVFLFLFVSGMFFTFKMSLNLLGDNDLLVFIIFVTFLPLSTIVAIGFSALNNNFFDLRQGKRLLPLISNGEVISSLIAFLSIPLILRNIEGASDDTSFLLYFSITGSLLCFFFQLYINNNQKSGIANNNLPQENENEESQIKIKIAGVFKDKYYTWVVVLSIVSMLSFVLIDFSFLAITREFFKTKTEITSFLGLFFGLIKFLEFIFKTFVSGKLIEKYGLKFGIGILPIFLLPCTLLSVLGIFIDFEQSINLIILSSNMMFLIVIKKSFDDPSYNLLFQPLEKSSKIKLQIIASGYSKKIGVVIAGVLLILIFNVDWDFLNQHALQLTTLLVSLSLAIWLTSVNPVIKNFKLKIFNLIKNRSIVFSNSSKSMQFATTLSYINSLEEGSIKNVSKKFFPELYLETIDLKHTDLNIPNTDLSLLKLDSLLGKLFDKNIPTLLRNILGDDQIVRTACIKILEKHKVKYNKVEDFLIEQLSGDSIQKLKPLLIKHEEWTSKIANFSDLIINNRKTNNYLNELFLVFFFQLSIIKNKDNYKVLIDSIGVYNGPIEHQIVKMLSFLNFSLDAYYKDKILTLLDEEVSYYTWLVNAIVLLEKEESHDYLIQLLSEEKQLRADKIFLILSILYEKEQVNLIKDAFNSDDMQNNVLANEMLQTLLDESIYDKIFFVFDNNNLNSSHRSLIQLYPQKDIDLTALLANILNYKFNKVSIIIRIEVSKLLAKTSNGNHAALISNLFHPNEDLKKNAYLSIKNNNESLYNKYYAFESEEFKSVLDGLVKKSSDNLVNKKHKLLRKSNSLTGLNSNDLFYISVLSEVQKDMDYEFNYLREKDVVLFVLKGTVTIQAEQREETFKEGAVISSFRTSKVAIAFSDDAKYIRIDQDKLTSVFYTSVDLTSYFLSKV